MMARSALFAVILASSLVGACTEGVESPKPAGTPAYLEKEYTAFRTSIKDCTARTGYDPERQQWLGLYELGAGELAWRDCAYGALRSTVIPATTHPELYLALIEKDKELTSGIQNRRFTRDQREAQIAEQRQRILEHEENQSDRVQSGLSDEERKRRNDFLTRSTHDILFSMPGRPGP